jgi:hypothetical protein
MIEMVLQNVPFGPSFLSRDTIMMHTAIHRPEMSDPSLWPMAVQHAAYDFNWMPQLDSGLCPLDVFNCQQ